MIISIQIICYVISIALQVSGALILLIYGLSSKKNDVLKRFKGTGIISKDGDTGELSYDKDALRGEYKTIYTNRFAFGYLAFGYLLTIWSDYGNTDKICITLAVLVMAIIIILTTNHICDMMIRGVNVDVSADELSEAGVEADIESISTAAIKAMFDETKGTNDE